MRLQAELAHGNIVEDFIEVEFSVAVGSDVQCALGREGRLLHTILVKNHAWGAHLKEVVIEYNIDTKDIGLCSYKLAHSCSTPSNAQVLTFQIPSVPQSYWKGSEKQIQVRTCVPDPYNESDFNISYKIKAVPESTDADLEPLMPLIIESNMHVLIL